MKLQRRELKSRKSLRIRKTLNSQLAISELVESDPKVDHNKEMKVYLTAREFYKETVAQIKTGFVFDDDFYEMSCLVEPSNAAKLNLSSLASLPVKYFSSYMS